MTLLNQSDFAKHISMTRGYVTQLKNAGRLVMQDGKVNVEESLQRIADTKDPDKAGVASRHALSREQKHNAELGPAPVLPHPSALEAPTASAGSAYQQARAMKEKYNAMSAKLTYEKEVKNLLPAEDIRFAVADGDTIIRNRLESLPDLLSPQLASESDEQKIRTLLTDFIEATLADLSRSFQELVKP